MGKEGRLIILETGSGITDFINKDGEERQRWLTSEHPFNAGCTVVPDAWIYADNRVTMSKQNKLFTYQVSQGLKDGCDIILIAPSKDMLDRRLRKHAIVFGLPVREGGIDAKFKKNSRK